MVKNSILLENLTFDELRNLFGDEFKKHLANFKTEISTHNPDELLTREQTCNFLQIDSSTLWAWTNKGKVIAYGIGNRRYYKKAELLNSLQQLKK